MTDRDNRTDLYTLMHRFYQLGLPAMLGADGTALYWALIQKSNELRDPTSFTFTNTEAKERAGITHDQVMSRARNKVLAAGLVRYVEGSIRNVGIYSDLDRTLDPDEVARRLRPPPNRKDSSQAAHSPITVSSQSPHNVPTISPQTAHTPAPETASGVSIIREKHNTEEENRSIAPEVVDNAAADEAQRTWGELADGMVGVAWVDSQVTAAVKRCQALRVDGNAIIVAYPREPDEYRQVGRVRAILDKVAAKRQLTIQFVNPIEARAGP